MYEIELHYAPTPTEDAHVVIMQVDASCHTELENMAYHLQMQGGYRSIRHPLTGKTRVVGLRIENVSFGPIIERDEDGQPAYKVSKSR